MTHPFADEWSFVLRKNELEFSANLGGIYRDLFEAIGGATCEDEKKLERSIKQAGTKAEKFGDQLKIVLEGAKSNVAELQQV
jgi:hypothetical protein